MIQVNRQGEVWVFAEQHNGELQDTPLELMSKARRLADTLGVIASEAEPSVAISLPRKLVWRQSRFEIASAYPFSAAALLRRMKRPRSNTKTEFCPCERLLESNRIGQEDLEMKWWAKAHPTRTLN
jgi:hypothetical protein